MSFSAQETLFMKRAMALAQAGLGYTGTNPLVGCVIVKNNKIIGEGFHKQYGGPHAEVEAVQSIKEPEELNGATVFVTLEPCAHYGKTPPCALLLKNLPIDEVVIALKDPFPAVAGMGIQILQEAGKKVRVGLLKEEAQFQNRRFLTRLKEQRPYIILKWAESANGIIGRKNGQPLKISSDLNKVLVHKWRAEESAILVGANTFIQDKPQLNVRHWKGPNPKRIVLSYSNSVAESPELLTIRLGHLWVFNAEKADVQSGVEFIKIEAENRSFFLKETLKYLSQEKGIASLLVEGGTEIHQSFLQSGLWDEVRVLKSKKEVLTENPVFAPEMPKGEAKLTEIGGDWLYTWYNSPKTN